MVGKKIKRLILKKLLFILAIIAIYSIFRVARLITNSVEPNKVEFKIDSVYSPKVQAAIQDFFDTNQSYTLSINDFSSELINKFNIVKKVKYSYKSPETVTITAKGSKPILKINNKFILSDNKQIFDLNNFKNFENNLKNIYVSQEALDNFNYNFFKKIPDNILQKYEINYLKDSYIALTTNINNWHKKDFFVFNTLNFLNNNLLFAQEINHKIKSKQRYKRGYSYDLRFKDRIYVKPIRGEGLEFAKIMGRE